MHRSRLSLLAIVAASACSTRGDAKGTDILSQDPALAAGLQDHQKARQLPLPDVCGAVAAVAQPTATAKRQAQALARQAYDAELVGNADSARSLLTRAVQLDATDRSAAYHLGRASETLGDRTDAVIAYCHYIALTPTMTESAEARQRVASLAQRETRVASGSISYAAPAPQRSAVAPARRVAHARPAATAPVAIMQATPRQPTRVASSERGAAPAHRRAASERSTSERSTSERDSYPATEGVDGVGRAPMPSDGASSAPSVEQPVTPAPTVHRGPSTIQSAGIGAIAGAIIGAATGRNVKSAMIGAAAGGVLGGVLGSTTRPTSRTFRPNATRGYQPATYVRAGW